MATQNAITCVSRCNPEGGGGIEWADMQSQQDRSVNITQAAAPGRDPEMQRGA